MLVHGDDYVSSGPDRQLKWLREDLEGEYTLTSQVWGSESLEGAEVKVLNRIARRTTMGYEIDGDPRHAELIVDQMCNNDDRPVCTPGLEAESKGGS